MTVKLAKINLYLLITLNCVLWLYAMSVNIYLS